ncbi:MAG: AAA domain-containing protein, partial [Leptospirales bacterium]
MSAKSRKTDSSGKSKRGGGKKNASGSGASEPASLFSSAEEELRSVLAALAREREAEQEEFRSEWLELSLSRRRALGVTLFPLEFVEASGTLGERWKLRFRYNVDGAASKFGRGHRFQSGQVVQMFRTGSDGETNQAENISGVLAELRGDRLVLIADDAPDWLEDGRVGINLAFNETTYREMERALREILENKNFASRRDRLLAYSPARRLAIPEAPADATPNLNAAQARAVRGVAAMGAGDFAVIHGPPGTGKTTTVVAAILGLLERGERVLVTAPTNAAVDLLAERLLEAIASPGVVGAGTAGATNPNEAGVSLKSRSKINLLRLGHPARVGETVLRHTLEGRVDAHPDAKTTVRYRAEADELYKKARKFRRNFGPAERAQRAAMLKEHGELRRLIRDMERGIVKHIVDTADVIVTTLVGAASK